MSDPKNDSNSSESGDPAKAAVRRRIAEIDKSFHDIAEELESDADEEDRINEYFRQQGKVRPMSEEK